MEQINEKLHKLLEKCYRQHIDVFQLKCVQDFVHKCKGNEGKTTPRWLKCCILVVLMFFLCTLYNQELQSQHCSLELPNLLRYAFRPPEDCEFCAQVKEIKRLRGITSQEFEKMYAYSGTPVVIEDATANWTALHTFDYWYLKDVYGQVKQRHKLLACQFLPYKTGFHDIFEALSMPEARVELQKDYEPWYFGWSNCYAETAEQLRQHYARPYFLPPAAENNAIDWIFMGTAGLGAQMHIDNVGLPSWQAQISGSKRWLLAPPPECYFRCQQMEIIVKPGDIIVLDTNKWYHQTFVQDGEVSLTIGAEYD